MTNVNEKLYLIFIQILSLVAHGSHIGQHRSRDFKKVHESVNEVGMQSLALGFQLKGKGMTGTPVYGFKMNLWILWDISFVFEGMDFKNIQR